MIRWFAVLDELDSMYCKSDIGIPWTPSARQIVAYWDENLDRGLNRTEESRDADSCGSPIDRLRCG